jgi:hypothetical protein
MFRGLFNYSGKENMKNTRKIKIHATLQCVVYIKYKGWGRRGIDPPILNCGARWK